MATMVKKNEIYREIEQNMGLVPAWVRQLPDTMLEGFWSNFRDFYMAETKIPNKYKELIGLAVSGATRCRYCTLFHTEGARLAGATDEEIAEASATAGMTMMASTFLNSQQIDYEAFRKETMQIVAYAEAHMPQAQQGVPPVGKQPPVSERGRH